MTEKTLGQIAYEAFVHSKECVPDWAASANQGAWEAADKAAHAAWDAARTECYTANSVLNSACVALDVAHAAWSDPSAWQNMWAYAAANAWNEEINSKFPIPYGRQDPCIQKKWEAAAHAVAERCAEVANRSMFVECDIYGTGYEEGKRDVKNAILDLCKVTP